MIIGIDASRANRRQKTGTEWYAYHLIRELLALDSQHQYILYSDEPLRGGLADLVSANPDPDYCPIVTDGWQSLQTPFGNAKAKILAWPPKRLWTQLRLSWELFRAKPDLLFVPSHALPLINGRRNLVTVHDIGFHQRPDLYPRGANKSWSYFEWSTKWAVKHAWKVLTVSEFSRQQIVDVYAAKPEQVSVIHNGYDHHQYHPQTATTIAATLKRHQLEQPYILSVGRLEHKKNTLTLIKAFAELKARQPERPEQLVLVGAPGYGFEVIEEYLRSCPVAEQVHLMGWLPEVDMPALFAGAAVFAFPSHYEGFGIPLLEAMASATPVVAANSSSLPEVAAEAALYFEPEQVRALTDRLEQILTDEVLAAKLRAAGLERAKDFSWQQSAQKLLALINQLS